MAERYVKLYSLPGRQYAQGAPCLLQAGALLKDTQTGSVLAQLKFHSITPKTIKMLKVAVTTYDGAGQALESNVEYQYTGLDVQRDESFGGQVPLVLKNSNAVRFNAVVCEVFFSNATTWTASADVQWLPLEEQETLDNVFDGDKALVEEYKRKFGGQSCYLPKVNGDVWLCACGTVNHKDEENCQRCGSSLQEMRAVSVASLQADIEERLQKEKEEQERKEQELLAKKKKRNKILAITLPIVCLAVAVIVVFEYGYFAVYAI